MSVWTQLFGGGGALVVFGGALWAYVRFVLERGLLPPVDFRIECRSPGQQADKRVVELLLHVKNLGGTTVVVRQLEVHVRYLIHGEAADIIRHPEEKGLGQLRFPHSLRDEEHVLGDAEEMEITPGRGLPVVNRKTYVRPKVDQVYTFVTGVPDTSSYLLVRGSFLYDRRVSRIAKSVLWLSQCLGLVQYQLKDVSTPHTAMRVFRLEGNAVGA